MTKYQCEHLLREAVSYYKLTKQPKKLLGKCLNTILGVDIWDNFKYYFIIGEFKIEEAIGG